MKNPFQIGRKNEVRTLVGLARTTFQNRINEQLLPPPISLGGRSVGFVLAEYEIVLQAMIAGKNENEIRSLVNELIEKRNTTTLGE